MNETNRNKTSYSVATIAKLLNITERRVQQLAKENVIPKADKGKYDLVGCIQGYITYLQNVISQGECRDLKHERTRLTKFQADRVLIDLQVIQGKAVLIPDVEKQVADMIAIVRARLLGLPNKLAPIIINETDVNVIEGIIKNSIYEALQELANLKL